jgi:aminopeptidase N
MLRKNFHCRLCMVDTVSKNSKAKDERYYSVPGSRPRYAPDRPFKLEKLILEVHVDPVRKTLHGTATQRFRVISPEQTHLRLDQVGLKIDEVKLNGKVVTHHVEGDSLIVEIAKSKSESLSPEITFEIVIQYRTHEPRRGIYFTGPDEYFSKKPFQVWTQGQDEDSKYWFPTLDYPNEKIHSEVIAWVPQGFTAISNGQLVEKKDAGNETKFHYRLGTPHVNYLVTLVVGQFSEIKAEGPRGLPVQYFVVPGDEDKAKRSFGNTAKMIELFETKTGQPYPYEKYSQVAVQDFIFGGMENTSATTQTDLTLHDERAHLDFTSDPLVSHELAHQWFGNLLTCRDWSHGWLNEGFATFMERVWVEADTGPHGGLEEAKYYSYHDLKDYLYEDESKYRRPIVCNIYNDPIDLFDRHLYQKGGLVLNLLRSTLGEQLFWKSIQLYVSRHKGQNVETLDLIRAIEDATGRNMRPFFDQWVFGEGFPQLEISYAWSDEKKQIELVIEQKQEGLFHLKFPVQIVCEDKKTIIENVSVKESRERIFISVPSKPLMVSVDAGHNIPKKLKFPRPKEMLIYQLKSDSDCMGRIEAAKELGKIADADGVEALVHAVNNDSFWGVRAEVASVLAEIRTPACRDGLVAALSTKNSKGRAEIARALGKFRDHVASDALRKAAEKDASYSVESAATEAWSHSRLKHAHERSKADIDDVEKFMNAQLEKESFRDVIRSSALKGIASLPGVGAGERSSVLQTLIAWTHPNRSMDSRMTAISYLGRLASTAHSMVREKILDLFSELANERNFRIRAVLVAAMETSEMPEAIGILDRIRNTDTDGRIRRASWVAISKLKTAGTHPESVESLKKVIEKLEEDQKNLKQSFEALKADVKPEKKKSL